MAQAARHRGPDGISFWLGADAGMAQLAFHVTPESVRETLPLLSPGGRFALVADARIDNRDELLRALRGEPGFPPSSSPSDADLILASFTKWGEACCERLLGDFAFAIWDAVEHRLCLVRDALGGRSLCYHHDGRRCLFASEPGQILDLPEPGFATRPNELRIAQYLASIVGDEELTFFESIFYCPSAHSLSVTRQGLRKRRYWEIDPEARIRHRDERLYAEQFLELVTDATRSRMRSLGPVGLALSGGLDSGLLAAVASGLLPAANPPQERLKTYSYVFDELASCDERRWIVPLVERYGFDATFLPSDDQWTLKDIQRWPVMRDYLWFDAYVLLPTAVAEAARQAGCKVLLNGQFGDALFIAGCYWAADLMRDGRWLELWRGLRREPSFLHRRRDLVGYGLRQLVPPGLKRWLRRWRPRSPARLSPALDRDLVARTGIGLPPADDPRGRRYTAPGQQVRLSTLTASFWTQGFGESRSYHNRLGLEVESPYHDRRLVEFIMALPAYQLGLPGRDRRVQRDAVTGLGLPEIGERDGKTGFDPLMLRGLCERETATVLELLRSPRCVERGFVSSDWLRGEVANLARGVTTESEALHGLWLCVCLELWLRDPAVRRLG